MRWWISNGVLWADTEGAVQDPQPPRRPAAIATNTAEWISSVEESRLPSKAAMKARRRLRAEFGEPV